MFKLFWCLLFITPVFLAFYISHEPKAIDTIFVHVGKPYEDVILDSTFPVRSNTLIRPTTPPIEDSTWFKDPVIVSFDDPQHGFTLPPTKFGAVGYSEGKVTTITTSPMLETLTFDQLIPLLSHLQQMLKDAGWPPEDQDNYAWLKIKNEEEKNTLQNLLFDQVVIVMLRVPNKYMLALNVKCYARCDERDPETAKYLIDVSIGKDFHSR